MRTALLLAQAGYFAVLAHGPPKAVEALGLEDEVFPADTA